MPLERLLPIRDTRAGYLAFWQEATAAAPGSANGLSAFLDQSLCPLWTGGVGDGKLIQYVRSQIGMGLEAFRRLEHYIEHEGKEGDPNLDDIVRMRVLVEDVNAHVHLDPPLRFDKANVTPLFAPPCSPAVRFNVLTKNEVLTYGCRLHASPVGLEVWRHPADLGPIGEQDFLDSTSLSWELALKACPPPPDFPCTLVYWLVPPVSAQRIAGKSGAGAFRAAAERLLRLASPAPAPLEPDRNFGIVYLATIDEYDKPQPVDRIEAKLECLESTWKSPNFVRPGCLAISKSSLLDVRNFLANSKELKDSLDVWILETGTLAK